MMGQWEAKRKVKEEVMFFYGGKCKCCGETELDFLCLHHVDENGASERLDRRGGMLFYLKLKREGYPTGYYRVLCFNCHAGIHANYGRCPHEEKRDH